MNARRKPFLHLEQLEERIFLDANPVADLSVDAPSDTADAPEPEEPAASETMAGDEKRESETDANQPADQAKPEQADGGNEGEATTADKADEAPASDETASPASSDTGETEANAETAPAEQDKGTVDEGLADDGVLDPSDIDPAGENGDDSVGSDAAPNDSNLAEADDTDEVETATSADDPVTPLTEAEQPATEAVDPLIGEPFTFTVTLDNTAGATLYGPYIDLYFPSAGDDGDGDGLLFDSATYLGTPVTSTVLTYNGADPLVHPYAVDSSGAPLEITTRPDGTALQANDTVVVLEMPFGSFTPDQPAAEVVVQAHFSDHAAVDPIGGSGQDQTVQVTNGFRFGNDALNNPTSPDPSQVFIQPSQTFRPEAIRFEKTYLGPENETAIGPNYVRTYQIQVNVAQGQTVDNLRVVEHLPSTIYYLGNLTGGTLTSPVAPGIYSNQDLEILIGSVNGTAGVDHVVTFDYYVPFADAAGDPIIPSGNGSNNDDKLISNNIQVQGDWVPLDGDDAPVTVTMDAEVFANGTISPTPDNDEAFTAKDIAAQKAVGFDPTHPGDNTGAAGYNPGDIVRYSLNFQIADYVAFGDLTLTDLLPDGMELVIDADHQAGFAVSDKNGPASGIFTLASTLTTTAQSGDDVLLSFRLSDALVTAGASDGVLEGGYTNGSTAGAATGTITYYARINNAYLSPVPGGNASVDLGDTLTNTATASGTLYTYDGGGTLQPTTETEQDGSSAQVQIVQGSPEKSIYAITHNGVTTLNPAGQPHIEPGDILTFRLRYTLPTSDYETLLFEDYLPLPILSATTVTGFDNITSATPPASGIAQFGPNDTFHALTVAQLGGDGLLPVLSIVSGANRVSFSFAPFDSASNQASTVDILFSITVSNDPFADGLYLTNQLQSVENGTVGQALDNQAITQFVLDQPELTITKGVVEVADGGADTYGTFTANNNVDIAFSEPGSGSYRFTANGGQMTSDWLAANDLDTNLSGVDAGDVVTFVVVVENTGHSNAYDLILTDAVPTGFAIPASGLNLSVTNGLGTDLAYSLSGAYPSGTLTITDDADGALAGIDGAAGTNILVITYDLVATTAVQPMQTLTNTATLTNYAGAEGAANHIPGGLADDASVTIATPTVTKTVTDTSEASTPGLTNVVIGEAVEYTVTVTVPEGSAEAFVFRDTLDSGLAFVGLGAIDNPAIAITYNGVNHTAETLSVSTGGGSFSIDFGALDTGAVNSNGTPETITIVYRAVVLNTLPNQQNIGLNNAADVSWTNPNDPNGTLDTANISTPNVIIQEPQLQVSKEVWNPATSAWVAADSPAGAVRYDAGDTNIQYRITVQHSTASREDAFDVTLNDVLPAGIDWSTATVNVSGSATLTGPLDSVTDGAFSASWDQLLSGQTTTFLISGGILSSATAGQVIANTGTVTWQSLANDPGAISLYNANSTERTGAGGVNDYTASNSAYITVAGTIDKLPPSPASYTIGDTVTYDIVVTLPEGATNNLVVTDALPSGMVYTGSNLIVTGFNGTVTATPAVNAVAGDGNDVAFSFGNVAVANDNLTTNNSFVLQVTTRVANVSGNQQGTILPDDASMTYANPLGGTTTIDDPTDPSVSVIEPRITTAKLVADSVDAGSDAQPGEILTYTASFTNTGASPAYEVRAEDELPAGVHFTGLASVTNSGGIDTTATAINISSGTPATGETLAIAGDWDIPVGGWVQVQYTVQVLAAGFTAGTYTNRVDADWSSQDGVQANERSYTDEVDGSGQPLYAVDQTQDEATASFAVLTPTGSIGDTVFFDADNSGDESGVFDLGIGGVRLTLTADVDGNGTSEYTRTVLTDASGQYAFTGLAAFNNYVITVDQDGGAGPGGTAFDLAGAGYSPTYDLDGTATAHAASGISLTDGQSRTDVDFGYTGQNSVGDRVWYDVNGDGVQDGDEGGLAGLPVLLLADLDGDNAFDLLGLATTDANGLYGFDHLPASGYRIVVAPTADMQPTYDLDSGTTSPDNFATFTLGADEDRNDIDFGYRGSSSIGDTVWFDANADGLEAGDATEPGISGVTVTLTGDIDGDGVIDLTTATVTDADGRYGFTNLLETTPGGGYTISIVTASLPGGLVPTHDLDGTATPDSAALTLASGEHRADVDFGYLGTGAIGDLVFFDDNRNHQWDMGEVGIGGVDVRIRGDIDSDGDFEYETTVTTDSGGGYLFSGLPGGRYMVEVVDASLPVGYSPSADPDGGAPDGNSGIIVLAGGQTNTTIDFGFAAIASLGDRIWYDVNGNGVQDSGEVGLNGVTVTLTGNLDNDPALETIDTITDTNGNYLFANLPPGLFTITVDSTTLPGGMVPTFDADGTSTPDVTADVPLVAGQSRTDIDFGYTGTGSVGDTIWNDSNRNGIQNPGEPGLAGVDVSIGIDLDGDGAPDCTLTATTDVNGLYRFDHLPAGAHIVRIDPTTLPAGMQPTYDPDGVLDNSHIVQLGAGEVKLDVDFAYATPPPPEPPGVTQEIPPVPPSPLPPGNGLVIDAFFLYHQFGKLSSFPFDRWLEIDYPVQSLPVAPLYTGLAEPGTTLTLAIYDSSGNQVGSQTIMADTAGNWLASFPGALLDQLPHSMTVKQDISLYNASTAGLFNLRTYFNPSFASQVLSTANLDVAAVFAYLPSTIMETMHLSHQHSFDIRWNDFHGYEFFAPSLNPARTGH